MKKKNRVVVVHVFCVSVVNTYNKLHVRESLLPDDIRSKHRRSTTVMKGVITLTLYTTVPLGEFRVIVKRGESVRRKCESCVIV